jgi:hypothetical protein
MTKTSVTRLFAVVALASACGLAEAGESKAQAPAPAGQTKVGAKRVERKVDQAPVAPRTLKNGRPACGNVGGKSDGPRNCERKAKS